MFWNELTSTFLQMYKNSMNCILVDIQLTNQFQPTVTKVHTETMLNVTHVTSKYTEQTNMSYKKNSYVYMPTSTPDLPCLPEKFHEFPPPNWNPHAFWTSSCFKSYNKAALTKCVYLLTLYQLIQILTPTKCLAQHVCTINSRNKEYESWVASSDTMLTSISTIIHKLT